jgi:hypothetical protein
MLYAFLGTDIEPRTNREGHLDPPTAQLHARIGTYNFMDVPLFGVDVWVGVGLLCRIR